MRGIETMRTVGREAPAIGTHIVFRARGAERESTITRWSPPTRITLESRQGGITATYAYSFEREGDGSRITLAANCAAHGLGWKILGSLIQFLMKKSDGGQLLALKELLESDPSGLTGPEKMEESHE